MHGPRCEKKRFLSVWIQYLHTGTDKKKNGIANEHVDVISTGIVCLHEQQSRCIKIRAKWEFLRPLSKLCWLSFWRRGNLLWRNCPCRNPIRLFSQNSRIHHGFLKNPTALKNKQDCYNFTGNRLTVLLKEQNKAPLNLDWRTLCLWLIVWTEPVSIDKHRCSDLVGWVSSLWEFQTWGLCWEITPVLIIWPWVSWCWTRREDWTLRSTSWRYC